MSVEDSVWDLPRIEKKFGPIANTTRPTFVYEILSLVAEEFLRRDANGKRIHECTRDELVVISTSEKERRI